MGIHIQELAMSANSVKGKLVVYFAGKTHTRERIIRFRQRNVTASIARVIIYLPLESAPGSSCKTKSRLWPHLKTSLYTRLGKRSTTWYQGTTTTQVSPVNR